MSRQLGIILPTNNPDNFFNLLAPTLKHIRAIGQESAFLINFQPPWNMEDMREAIRMIQMVGFYTKYTYTKGWDKPIKITEMREVCARLDSGCDFYLFIDDDFKLSPGTKKFPYNSGQRYAQSLDYLNRHPRCGAINTKSFLGGHQWGLKIAPSPNKMDDMYATNRGLFLRNMRDYDFTLSPLSMHDLRGDLEESATVFSRIELGFYTAKQMNNPTIHLTGKLSKYDNDPLNMHNFRVINENVRKWIRERYNDPEWEYEQKRLPAKLWDLYLSNGGPDITNPKFAVEY